jgi:CRISPR/Cas system-associated exonuclease Cas4 (RecB family)
MINENESIAPPPFVQRYQYQELKQVTDSVTRKRIYLTPNGDRLPSVTTILSSTKDMTHLNEWKKRVGEENAKRITTEAAGIGTAMHANLERYLCGMTRKPGNNQVHVQANKMADIIIQKGLSHVNEVWAMEQSLYFPGLYSGTTDLCGVFKGKPAIMDHKQTNKPKKEEWVEDYKLQLVAYALAHNEVHGTDIKTGVVFMCSRDLQYQQFEVTEETFHKYKDMWLDKVEQYYNSL